MRPWGAPVGPEHAGDGPVVGGGASGRTLHAGAGVNRAVGANESGRVVVVQDSIVATQSPWSSCTPRCSGP